MLICDHCSSAILSTLLPVPGVVSQCRHTTCKGERYQDGETLCSSLLQQYTQRWGQPFYFSN